MPQHLITFPLSAKLLFMALPERNELDGFRLFVSLVVDYAIVVFGAISWEEEFAELEIEFNMRTQFVRSNL